MSVDPFERVRLGRAPVEVRRLGVGLAALSGLFRAVTDEEATVVLDHAWDRGVRYFDTAPLYGYGLGEQRVGRLLQRHDHAEWVLSSKVGRLLYPIAEIKADPSLEPDRPALDIPGIDGLEGYFKDAPDLRPVFDYSYDGVMRSVEDHWPGPDSSASTSSGSMTPTSTRLKPSRAPTRPWPTCVHRAWCRPSAWV